MTERTPDEGTSILRLAMPRGRQWAKAVASGVMSAVCGVALIAASGYLITRAAEHPPILYLTLVIVGVRAFALGRAAFRYTDKLAGHDAAFRQLATVRTEMYRKLTSIAPTGLGARGRGDLLTRLVTDTDRLQDLALRVVGPLVTSAGVALLSVVTVTLVLPSAGLVLCAALAASAITGTLLTLTIARRSDRATATARGEVADLVLDTVREFDVFAAYGVLDQRLAEIDVRDKAVVRAVRRRAAIESTIGAAGSLIGGLAVVGTLAVGAPQVVAGTLQGPWWALAVFVPLALFEVVQAVPVSVLTFRAVRTAAARVDRVLPRTVPAELVREPDLPEADDHQPPPGAVTLAVRGLAVRWPGADHPSIADVAFTVRPGEVVLLAGPSGAGKSTLVHALVRFVEYGGSYAIDGVEARTMHPDAVRARVGLIEQDPFVFDQSIRQNLLFACDTASDDDLLTVLERVGLGGWVARRGGLGAPVGERGVLLSGGQAHRLALARALLHAFPLLILDEPTAGIDPDLAAVVVRDLVTTARAAGRSMILVSHVPVAPDLVDRELRMEHGRLVER